MFYLWRSEQKAIEWEQKRGRKHETEKRKKIRRSSMASTAKLRSEWRFPSSTAVWICFFIFLRQTEKENKKKRKQETRFNRRIANNSQVTEVKSFWVFCTRLQLIFTISSSFCTRIENQSEKLFATSSNVRMTCKVNFFSSFLERMEKNHCIPKAHSTHWIETASHDLISHFHSIDFAVSAHWRECLQSNRVELWANAFAQCFRAKSANISSFLVESHKSSIYDRIVEWLCWWF